MCMSLSVELSWTSLETVEYLGNRKPAHCPLVDLILMFKSRCKSPDTLTWYINPPCSSFDQLWGQPGVEPGGRAEGQTGHSERRNSGHRYRGGRSGERSGESSIMKDTISSNILISQTFAFNWQSIHFNNKQKYFRFKDQPLRFLFFLFKWLK